MTGFDFDLNGARAVLRLHGCFDTGAVEDLQRALNEVPQRLGQATHVVFDFAAAERVETNCAYILLEAARELRQNNLKIEFSNLTQPQENLFKALGTKSYQALPKKTAREDFITLSVRYVGEAAIKHGHDGLEILSFFGEVMLSLGRILKAPEKLRYLSVLTHIERAGLKAVPIVCLMSFLIGGIIAQQGAFQLKRFGAEIFVVNLIGILVLRELGVLLAAIMFAGRSGSAYTAEIGSMKMREEIDAMRVIGLNPVEVLAVPRLVALMIALPLVTVLSNLSALFGGMLVCWSYLGIEPAAFISQIQNSVAMTHVYIGLVKAPFMAIIIGIIACVEGLRVQGSTESLGTHTTASVVKAIFMVIVVDGVFAIIFTAMDL